MAQPHRFLTVLPVAAALACGGPALAQIGAPGGIGGPPAGSIGPAGAGGTPGMAGVAPSLASPGLGIPHYSTQPGATAGDAGGMTTSNSGLIPTVPQAGTAGSSTPGTPSAGMNPFAPPGLPGSPAPFPSGSP